MKPRNNKFKINFVQSIINKVQFITLGMASFRDLKFLGSFITNRNKRPVNNFEIELVAKEIINIKAIIEELESSVQPALGFTPENIANKATDLTSPDNTKYPTTLAVSNALATSGQSVNKIMALIAAY